MVTYKVYFVLSFFFKLIFIGVELLCNVVLVSAIEQIELSIHIDISPLFGFPSHLGHHRALGRVSSLYSWFSLVI